ncbi:M15 family metallopeptidase [Streptomyces sp. NPDC006879]|uniref:M15 family metallopeptidase n=1 Tax=Streptomyces sp. NPDC006879 TaxID=3364767 RepID=UPI0036CD8AF9
MGFASGPPTTAGRLRGAPTYTTALSRLLLVSTLLLVLAAGSAGSVPPPGSDAPSAFFARTDSPGLEAKVSAVPATALATTYRPGCPVPPERLRLIQMNHWGFDGKLHAGELVVRDEVVRDVLSVFERAFEERFPIRRMQVADRYQGSDARAMAADNTSAFNCRPVTGDPGRLSRHSWGDAIDVNPSENPYVDVGGRVHPAASDAYLDRDPLRPGMVHTDGPLVKAFAEVGWEWGGTWSNPDYQHFSATGR